MKQRDKRLDYIRILSTALIVWFHFFSTYPTATAYTVAFKNGVWGYLGTSVFFVLSGFLLRKNHKKIPSVTSFYKKRWLAIFPSFYIAYIVAYAVTVCLRRSFLYNGPAYEFIYSILGVDKYVELMGFPTYALVGEWFTAVILVLYLVYPFINRAFSEAKLTLTGVLVTAYILFNAFNMFPVNNQVSVLNALCLFVTGMFIAEYELRLTSNKLIAIVYGVISCILLLIKVPIENVYCVQMLAVALFLLLLTVLPSKGFSEKENKVTAYLAGISYCVYLVHHFILFLMTVFDMFVDIPRIHIAYFAVFIALTILSAGILKFISDKLIHINKKREG